MLRTVALILFCTGPLYATPASAQPIAMYKGVICDTPEQVAQEIERLTRQLPNLTKGCMYLDQTFTLVGDASPHSEYANEFGSGHIYRFDTMFGTQYIFFDWTPSSKALATRT